MLTGNCWRMFEIEMALVLVMRIMVRPGTIERSRRLANSSTCLIHGCTLCTIRFALSSNVRACIAETQD